MQTLITPERPDTPDATALIAELEAYLEPLYPRESRHGYSVEKLIAEGVAFFLIRDGGASVGCGGIKLMGADCGEIKRMYVRPQFRGLGFAKLMLNHLADYARSQGVGTLYLDWHPSARCHGLICARSTAPFGAGIGVQQIYE